MKARKILALIVAVLMIVGSMASVSADVTNWGDLLDQIENGDGNITLGDDVAGPGSPIAEVDGTEYADLSEAFAAANGKTVTLLSGIKTSATITIPADTTVTVDLNGHIITAEDDTSTGNYELFYNYGKLTVKNGTINLSAKTDRDWNAASSIFHNRGGELIIESGTYTHNGGTDMAYVVDNNGNSYGDAKTTIDGGKLTSSYIVIRNRMDTYGANGGGNGIPTLIVNNGELAGKYAIWGQVSSSGAKGTIQIYGGTFTAAEGKATVLVDSDSNSTGEIKTEISGGTFSSDVSEFLIDGLEIKDNGDGTFGVQEEASAVATYDELLNALKEDKAQIIMTADITADATESSGYGKAGIVLDAGDVLDGNGHKLTINNAGSTWDCVIAMRGGTVKNLTIAGAMRGVFMPGANGNVVIENCVFEDVIYTFNSDAGSKDYTVTIKNTKLFGWTSFSNVHKSVTFENCEFGEGRGYSYCRPYQPTTFTGCEFNEGYEFDTTKVDDNTHAFNNCTYDGEALSADNSSMFYDGGSVLINGTATDVTQYAAKIGDQKYLTLEEALGKAETTDTIVLINDAAPALTSQRAITDASVIDLGGKTLTLKEDDLYFGTTTFKNGTIVVDPSVVASTAVFWMFEGQTLIFNDVDIVATGVTGCYLMGTNGGNGAEIKIINGSTITIENDTAASLTAVIAGNGANDVVTIDDSTINVSNITGRLALGGSYTVEGNSVINANGVKEGFYIRDGQSLSIVDNTNVNITLNPDNETTRYGINLNGSATYNKADTANVNATDNAPITEVDKTLPNAEVKNLGAVTVGEEGSDYECESHFVYDLVGGSGLSTSTETFDLGITMEFIAKDTSEEAAANYYGNYTTDFFIKMTGVDGNTFKTTADYDGSGCYLAGYYPSYGAWVRIPLDNFEIENGNVYPVITLAGFDFKYTAICGSVQDFICGIYLTPEVLEKYPELKVNLSLGLSENMEAALNSDFTTVGAYTYDVDDFGKRNVNWGTGTDAGFYMVGDTPTGVMRFLFAADINETITESGIKYIKTADISQAVNAPGVQGTVSAFYGDVTGIPEGTEGSYLAMAYIKTASGIYWSDVVECSPDFTKHFTEYTAQ